MAMSKTEEFIALGMPVQLAEKVGAPASTTEAGTVKKAAAQADSTAEDVEGLVADFNTLLTNLRAAGIINT
jgi:hypothetical protein